MKIIHFKLNFRIILLCILVAILILSWCFLSKILPHNTISMNQNNYTTILKDIHNNTFDFSGDKIKLSGYIFKVPDFKENQFVIARNMMISETEYRVVGFLCEYNGQEQFESDNWVKAEGIITLSNYHGPIPIIQITSIKRAKMPEDVSVLPPE